MSRLRTMSAETDDPDNLLSVSRVAKKLDVSEDTVRRRIKAGELEAVKLGYRTLRVSAASLRAYVASHPADRGASAAA